MKVKKLNVLHYIDGNINKKKIKKKGKNKESSLEFILLKNNYFINLLNESIKNLLVQCLSVMGNEINIIYTFAAYPVKHYFTNTGGFLPYFFCLFKKNKQLF